MFQWSNHADKAIDEPKIVTETFNHHFVDIGQKLAHKIPDISISNCKMYLTNRVKNSIFLEPPRNNEIYNIINSLKSKSPQNIILFPHILSKLLDIF